jgi:hypothetical protein
VKSTRQKQKSAREVTGTVSAAAVVNLTFVRMRPVELRQRQDETWALWYPDPGFNPCDCSKKCLQETLAGPRMIESSYIGQTLDDALREAREISGVGEPRIIPRETHSERMQRVWAERKDAKSAA